MPVHRLLGDFVSTANGDIFLTATDVGEGPAIEIQLLNGCYFKCGVNMLVGVSASSQSGNPTFAVKYRPAHDIRPMDKILFADAESIYTAGGKRDCAQEVGVATIRKLKSVSLYAINEFAELFVNNVLCMTRFA